MPTSLALGNRRLDGCGVPADCKSRDPVLCPSLPVAFDTVNQQILQSTLSELGVSETALGWLRSYLSG